MLSGPSAWHPQQVKLRTVTEVVPGQTTDVFKRFMLRDAGLSFSLKYTDDDGSRRTLDLTCQVGGSSRV